MARWAAGVVRELVDVVGNILRQGLYRMCIGVALCMPLGSFKPLTKSTKHQEEYRHQYLQRGGAEVTSL